MPTRYVVCTCSELGCNKKSFTNSEREIVQGLSMSTTAYYKHQDKIQLFRKRSQLINQSTAPEHQPLAKSSSHQESSSSFFPVASSSNEVFLPTTEEVST